jgi:hypothetical protein
LRAARLALALAAAAAVLAVATPSLPARAEGAAPAGPSAAIELVRQTPVAVPGQPFVADVRLTGVPADGSITLDLHRRIRSRSELALSMEGDELGSLIYHQVTPVSALASRPGGVRRVTLPLAPAPGGLRLPIEGVYAVELIAHDAANQEVATLVTHLIVPPEEGDDNPNLAVAAVAELAAPPALRPDGSVAVGRQRLASMEAITAGLASAPGVPATLDVRPETLEALQRSEEPRHVALLDALQDAAGGRLVLHRPYVDLDLDGMVHADLGTELAPQLDRGRAVVESTLGTTPDDAVQVAPRSLGATGLSTLAFTGTTKLLLDDAALEPLGEGIISYSLAQPFVVAVPEESESDDRTPGGILGLAPDPIVLERLATEGTPGLAVSRVLAELALLRLERPGVARTAVVPLRDDIDPETVAQLLTALGQGRPFAAVTLPEAFEHAAPVLDGGGNPAARALLPDDGGGLPAGVARDIAAGRAAVDTFRTLVGPESLLPEVPSQHVLVAAALGLDIDERRAHLDAATAAIESVTGQVSMPATFTLTLTARDGTIPLTLRNDSGVPVRVSIRLRSEKLEFPDGATVERVLTEPTTRIDLRVRSRATGAFPLVVDVRTPDGVRTLAASRYTVRSTAVSGVGLLLSIGAGVFLVVWWARHWRRTRRSKKLIAANGHPAAAD